MKRLIIGSWALLGLVVVLWNGLILVEALHVFGREALSWGSAGWPLVGIVCLVAALLFHRNSGLGRNLLGALSAVGMLYVILFLVAGGLAERSFLLNGFVAAVALLSIATALLLRNHSQTGTTSTEFKSEVEPS